MATPPLAFTGVSSYSDDFQSILSRAVSIAKLPIQRLQNQQADLLQKKQLLAGMGVSVTALASSLHQLGTLSANQALAASSSDASRVLITNTGATQPASWTVSNITSVAHAASETSVTGYADSAAAPVSSNGHVQLVYGTQTFDINLSPAQNNLIGLRNAINALGSGISASIITSGTGAAPNFLSVSAQTPGATTLQLNDIPASGPASNLITSANQGANTVFQLNGISVSRASTTINDVVPGVSFTILNTTAAGQSVSVSLATDRSQISSALSDFAQKYNTVVDQVNAQIGPGAGQLSGDFVVREVAQDLQAVSGYQGYGSIRSLATLGISLDSTGKMSFDPNAFNALSDSQVSASFAFLGSPTSGFAGLSATLTQLSDPATGMVQTEENAIDKSSGEITSEIASINDRVSVMQSSLTARLQQADALLAQLESQQKIITASIQSVNLSLFGKNNGNGN